MVWPLKNIMHVKKAVISSSYFLKQGDWVQAEASGRPGSPSFYSKGANLSGFLVLTWNLSPQFEPQGSRLGVRRVEVGRGGDLGRQLPKAGERD